MNGQKIGYKRVSTIDQNTARQLDGVPLDKLFEDKASGKDTNRPELQAALGYCREGDTLVVHSMDRLARSLVDLRGMVTKLTERGVAVEFVKENLRFNGDDSPMAILLLSLLGAVAEFERSLILERQREGIALAKVFALDHANEVHRGLNAQYFGLFVADQAGLGAALAAPALLGCAGDDLFNTLQVCGQLLAAWMLLIFPSWLLLAGLLQLGLRKRTGGGKRLILRSNHSVLGFHLLLQLIHHRRDNRIDCCR